MKEGQEDVLSNSELLSQLPDDVVKSIKQKREVMSVEDIKKELPAYLRNEESNDEYSKGFFRGPIVQKFVQNPFAFVAIGVTCFFFGRAIFGAKAKATHMTINRNLQNRVKAQGFAIAAIAGGGYYSIYKRKQEDEEYNRRYNERYNK